MFKKFITVFCGIIFMICGLGISSFVTAASTISGDVPPGLEVLIKESKELAKLGLVINSNHFGVGSSKSDILKSWGKPDEQGTSYLAYKDRGIRFHIDTTGHVNLVYSYYSDLFKLTREWVTKVLGTPDLIEGEMGGKVHFVYHCTHVCGAAYNLIFNWKNVNFATDNPEENWELTSISVSRSSEY